MKRILVLCTHNSARSQMGEAWLRHLGQAENLDLEVWSAGTEKTRVKPEAAQVMAEIGIDLKSHFSKTIEEVPGKDSFDAVMTVCDSAAEACPLFPGSTRRYHVSLPDPSGHDLQRWRASREQIGALMRGLVASLKSNVWPTEDQLNLCALTQSEE